MERNGEDEEEKNEDVYPVQLRPKTWKCMLCGLRVQVKMQKQLPERTGEMWLCPKERRGNGMNKKNTDTKQWIQEIREFVHERDAALRSLDRRLLLAYFQKYQIPVPENEMIFWASVHRARLGIRHITQKEQ